VRKSVVIAIAAAAFALLAAAQAGAATWFVAAGEQARPPAGTPKGSTLNQFLPSKLAVNAGDKVTFSSASFHTVTYLGKQRPPGLQIPDPAKSTYESVMDAAGESFYFNGLAKLVYNGLVFGPSGGTTVTGTNFVNSGVLAPGGPKQKFATITFTFPKAGSYRLICAVHPGMKSDVAVKAAGTKVPLSPTQVKAKILTEQAAGWTAAKKLAASAKPAANTVYQGVGGLVAILAYFPSTIKVKAGTTINFPNRSPTEVHNVAFGPRKWIDAFQKKNDLFPMGPGGKNQVTPFFPYGSEAKGKYVYDGANHGNGFLATPLTAGSPLVPLPKASKVTFTKAGTFKYFCLIHGVDMSGTVIVTP